MRNSDPGPAPTAATSTALAPKGTGAPQQATGRVGPAKLANPHTLQFWQDRANDPTLTEQEREAARKAIEATADGALFLLGEGAAAWLGKGLRAWWLARAVLPQAERLRLFYGALRSAQPARNADEAFNLLSRTLNAVEDAHSGVKAVANPGLGYTGRMYPPMADNVTRLADGGLEAVTKGQRLLFGPDGSIRIFAKKTGKLIFSKAGL